MRGSIHLGRIAGIVLNIRDHLLEGMQQDFPVLDDSGRLIGMLYRSDVIEAIRRGDQNLLIGEVMVQIDDLLVSPSHSLRDAMQMLQERGVPSLAVAIEGRLVGLLTQENIWELLVFREHDRGFDTVVSAQDPASSEYRPKNSA